MFASATFVTSTASLSASLDAYTRSQKLGSQPAALYAPMDYMLALGGKRLRPLLVMTAYGMYGNDPRDVLSQAFAIELFHNFTLIHDDIMDRAALRRGAVTVHEKFGMPSAILSGDAMLVYAYRYLMMNREEETAALLDTFNRMAIGVCEGQQLDLVFETQSDVSGEDYIQMIGSKTGALLGAALKIGGQLAHAPQADCDALYEFGLNTGIAFQLLDDVLDTFGDARVGKTIGGDIVQNKKTILYTELMREANAEQLAQLQTLYRNEAMPTEEKIKSVKKLFIDTGALDRARQLVEQYHRKALSCLDSIRLTDEAKQPLRLFSEQLMQRSH